MNLILENSKYVDYYTYLDRVFEAIPQLQSYEWHVSDLECISDEIPNNAWISGKELYKIVKNNKMQIIWGVFSAFEKRITISDGEIPYADGNGSFWKNPVNTQLQNALFEIVAWDSSLTLFIGCDKDISERLVDIYPDIKNLEEVNKGKP